MPLRINPATGKPYIGHPLTREQKILRRAERRVIKELAFDLKQEMAVLLPLAFKEVKKIVKSRTADPAHKIRVFENVADRLYGKASQPITGNSGGPLLIAFTQLLGQVDGSKHEKFPEQ